METIYSYTRAQAVEDGVLVDVTETAKQVGFRFPVAVTQRLWNDYIVPDKRSRKYGQQESGRLWDVLNMLSWAARDGGGSELHFGVIFVMKEKQRREITLKALVHPGDTREPVITIMMPDED